MSIKVNTKGVNHAKALIREGKVDLDSDWEFTAEDGNEILGDGDWNEYSRWFLAVDLEEDEETKARYKFPHGKKGKVYRRGVIAAKQRASQYDYKDIVEVADELLTMIDEKYSEKQVDMSPVRRVFKGKVTSVDETNATLEAVVSDETVDRYNEVILASAWVKGLENYKKHPILLSSHNYHDLTSQIGYAERIWLDGKELRAKFKYFVGEGNEQADWGFNLAKKGLAAFSVGFIPKNYTQDEKEIRELLGYTEKKKNIPKTVYKEVELLEVSQVLIPANPSALAKDLDPVVKSIADEFYNNQAEKSVDKLDTLFDMVVYIDKKIDNLIETVKLVEELITERSRTKYKSDVEKEILAEVEKVKNILKKFTM